MSLYRKLSLLFIAIVMLVLGSTLTVVYTQSRAMMVSQAKQKTVLLIHTINSALEAGIPDYNFEAILLHLSAQNSNIQSFSIYKLNGYFYDIASTDPSKIGSLAPKNEQLLMSQGRTESIMKNNILHIIAPVLINGVTIYSADVNYSLKNDLASTAKLFVQFLVVGIVAIALAALALWGFSKRILSRPLLMITTAANDIAGGRFQVDLGKLDQRKDEMGMLARSFMRMANNLRDVIAGISETSDNLQRSFQELVTSGDSTVQGALHVTSVMEHLRRTVSEQLGYAQALTDLSLRLQHRMNSDAGSEIQLLDAVERDLEELTKLADQLQVKTSELSAGLNTILATADGQLSWIQETNRSTAKLEALAAELRELTSIFDLM
jgi:methyl-accepting chemotaxis protein